MSKFSIGDRVCFNREPLWWPLRSALRRIVWIWKNRRWRAERLFVTNVQQTFLTVPRSEALRGEPVVPLDPMDN